MRVLLDTNVIITFLTKRADKFLQESIEIMEKCINGSMDGFVAFHSLSTISYVFRKLPIETRLEWMRLICECLTIACPDNLLLSRALQNEDFIDIEDNLQDCCAQSIQADYIITANVDDYGYSVIPAISPADFMAIISRIHKGRKLLASPERTASLTDTTIHALHQVSIQVIRRHHHHLLDFAG